MSAKEAAARIKISKLLEAAGWRSLPEGDEPASICLEPSVTLTSSQLDAFGQDFGNTSRGLIDFLLLGAKGHPLAVLADESAQGNA